MSLKNQIFASKDLKTDTVDTTEWGIPKLNIRELTAAQRESLFQEIQELNGKPMADDRYFAVLITMGAVDSENKLIFSEDDIDALLEKSPSVLRRIGKAINELSGITDSAVEDAEKN